MSTYTAPSGAKVEITLSSYDVAFNLFRAVLKSARKGGITSKIPDDLSVSNMNMQALGELNIKDFGGLADIVIDIIASPEVEELLFQCFQRCTYEAPGSVKEKITKDTFEIESRRGDFLSVAWAVGWANIKPFIGQLTSLFTNVPQEVTSGSQEQK